MPEENTPQPQPQVQPQNTVSEIKKETSKIIPILVFIGVLGWILAGFFSYSYKNVKEALIKKSDVSSSSVTIKVPMEVAGKIVYKTITESNRDVKTETDKYKETTIIKSGVGLGVALSTKANQAVYIVPDLFPLGPGNVQTMLLASKDEQYIGIDYRINF